MKTLIIDSNNIAYIVRFAFGDELSHDEEQTGILWGFFNQIWKLACQFETNKFIFAWDSRKSYRRMYYCEYKANRRDKTREDRSSEEKVYAQFTTLRKTLLPQFGFKNIHMHTGLEADDIMASLVLNREWDEPPILVSTDKDLYQLLEYCDVWRPLPGDKKVLMTSAMLMEQYGIKPSVWVRMRALEGDKSDNLPNVAYGVGTKNAVRYLKGLLPQGKLRKSITSPEGQFIMNRNIHMMTLPYPETPTFPIPMDEVFKVDDFMQICDRYQFNHFLKAENLQSWRNVFHMED